MQIDQLYQKFKQCSVICTDTRKEIPANSMFFALSGPNFNANRFAKQALEQGARFAVVSEDILPQDDRCIVVEDTLETLQALATYHREKLTIPVLAITGSNGKTTTKELIASVLSQGFSVYATKGNLNNHIGVPLSLLEVCESKHEIAIIEMGANHQGEIAAYCKWAQPTHGMITNIGKAHIEGFGGVEGIIKGKTELYQWLAKHDGTVFYNTDSKVLPGKASIIETRYTYGTQGDVYLLGQCLQETPFVTMQMEGETIETQLIGQYNFTNALAAAAIGKYFGLRSSAIAKGISSYIPKNNRSQVKTIAGNTVVLDAYNANPTSMVAALQNLIKTKANRKLAVLGDMFELGEEEAQEHREIISFIAKNPEIEALFCGQRFSAQKDACPTYSYYPSAKEARASVQDWLRKHDDGFVLIKGSRSMAMEEVLTAEQRV